MKMNEAIRHFLCALRAFAVKRLSYRNANISLCQGAAAPQTENLCPP
jgi:hypothetical protein